MSTGAPRDWHQRRHEVANRDGGWKCWYCHEAVVCPGCNRRALNVATLDHVMPKAHGGTDAPRNLRIACQPCNQEKADTMVAPKRRPPFRSAKVAPLMVSVMEQLPKREPWWVKVGLDPNWLKGTD